MLILPFISIGQTKYLFYEFEKKYSVFIIHESLWLECNDKYWVFLRESSENRYFVWPILIKCLLQIPPSNLSWLRSAISCLPDLAKGHDTSLREKLVIFVFVVNRKKTNHLHCNLWCAHTLKCAVSVTLLYVVYTRTASRSAVKSAQAVCVARCCCAKTAPLSPCHRSTCRARGNDARFALRRLLWLQYSRQSYSSLLYFLSNAILS